LLADILKQFNQYLFNKLTSFEKKSLYLATGTTNQGDFMKKLTNPQSLQTKLDPELITLKNQLENLAFLFNENTKALHQNTAAINANTNALTASNDAKFLSDSIQFINKQDAGIDKRKLRIVK
jgi:hypothetical protein